MGVISSPLAPGHAQPHRLRILVAELEDVADLDRLVQLQPLPQTAQGSPSATWRRSANCGLKSRPGVTLRRW